MTFAAPPALRPLLARLSTLSRSSGIETWIVGGTVRDVLLGRPIRDLDLAVDGDAKTLARRVAEMERGHFVLLDDDAEHAVARVVLDDGPVACIDIARLRGSLTDDLPRRDFTIDAMAVQLDGTSIIDVTGGLADLMSGRVRLVSEDALDADPLRMLRGVRIAAELGFIIESRTEAAITRRASRVVEAAAERRRDELSRIFALDATYPALGVLDGVGLLDALLPELGAGRGVAQPENHHVYDVFEHGLRTVAALDAMLGPPGSDGEIAWVAAELWRTFAWRGDWLRAYLAEELREGRSRACMLKLAGLLHDVAKPQTRSVDDDGRVRFFGHADAGADVARRILRRLRFSAVEVRFVGTLVAEHLRPVQLGAVGEVPTHRALYRFFRDLDDAAPAVLLLALADAAAARGPRLESAGWVRHVQYMNSLLVRSVEETGIVGAPRLLTGDDVMAHLGIPEGPMVGVLLEELREAQAGGGVADRDQALRFVKERADSAGSEASPT